jgi:hypothetical protein
MEEEHAPKHFVKNNSIERQDVGRSRKWWVKLIQVKSLSMI